MEFKSFWIIVLRIAGIWLIVDSLGVVGQFFSSVFILISMNEADNLTAIVSFISLVILVFVYFLCIRLFIVKPTWLISKLKLDQDFNEPKLELRVHNETIIRIACIIIGAILVTDGLPNLVREAYDFFQSQAIFRENLRSPWILLEIAKCIMAYFLIANNKILHVFYTVKSKTMI